MPFHGHASGRPMRVAILSAVSSLAFQLRQPKNVTRDADKGYFTFSPIGEIESRMLDHVRSANCNASRSGEEAVNCVLEATDRFCWQEQRMMLVGEDKGTVLEAELRRQVNVTQQTFIDNGNERPFVALELGTYVGYSTTRLARLMPKGSILYTVEFRKWRQEVAKEFVGFSQAHLKPKVEFLLNEAASAIDELGMQGVIVDFVFMDHYEDDYFNAFRHLEASGILREGTILVSDNIGVSLNLQEVQYFLNHVRRAPWMSYSIEHVANEYTAEEDAVPDSMEVSVFSPNTFARLGRLKLSHVAKRVRDAKQALVDHLRVKRCFEKAHPAGCVFLHTDNFAKKHPGLDLILGSKKGALLDALMMQRAARTEGQVPFVAIELGTFVGYSTVRLARSMPQGSKLYTVDSNHKNLDHARELVSMAGHLPADVHFLHGDARSLIAKLGRLGTKADFVFFDHNKTQYYSTALALESSGLLKDRSLVVANGVRNALRKSDRFSPMLEYISHTRASGLYSSYSVEWVQENVTFRGVKPQALDSLEVSTWVAESACSRPGESCLDSRCCVAPGTRCFERDASWAECRDSCDAGSSSSWSCNKLVHMIPESARETGMELLPGK